jgi:hypothetical protein
LEAELFHNRHRKEGLTRLPRQGRTSLSRDPPTSSSSQPGLPSPSTSSFSSDISQDAKVTALPSIKELEFPRYYSSSPSGTVGFTISLWSVDMSRGQEIETGSPYYYGSPEIFSMPSPRDNPFRPSSYRDLQGEPVYPTRPHHPHLQPTQVPVTSISPREIYKHPYPSESSRERVPTGTMFGRRGSSQRRDPQYVKRPRRRADEVERIYVCNWPECDKSYGALNHLNTHVRNAEHGPKREPKGI